MKFLLFLGLLVSASSFAADTFICDITDVVSGDMPGGPIFSIEIDNMKEARIYDIDVAVNATPKLYATLQFNYPHSGSPSYMATVNDTKLLVSEVDMGTLGFSKSSPGKASQAFICKLK